MKNTPKRSIMKKFGFVFLVSAASFLMVSCDSGSSSSDEGDSRNPVFSGEMDGGEFVCDVEVDGGNLRQVANIPGECEAFAEIVDNGDGTSLMSTEMMVYGKSAEEYEFICDSLSEMSNVFVPGSYQCKNGYFKFKILVDNNKINLDEIARSAEKECEQNRIEYEEKIKTSNPGLNDNGYESGDSRMSSNSGNVDSNPHTNTFDGKSSSSASPSSLQNSVTCNVSKEGDKVVQRMTLNQFGIVENVISEYEWVGTNWRISAVFSFDGIAAESNASDLCQEMREDMAGDALSFSCDAQSVSFVEDLPGENGDANSVVSFLQDECDEIKSSYNGYDFEGPRDAPDEIPTSCNVTESGNSMTVNLVYSDWSYSSTIVIDGEKIHETEMFYGNYGDYADLMCATDKADPENENVVCNGAEIQLDSDSGEFSKDEMKQMSQMMCDYLQEGLMSFDDLIE